VLISSSCIRFSSDEDLEQEKIKQFFEMRVAGNTEKTWNMLSNESRSVFSVEEFKEYSFIYKVSEIIEITKGKDHFEVKYYYYDKKYKKDSDELYTFYITENIENLKIDKTGIVFPYTGYTSLRKGIEKGDMEKVGVAIRKMLKIDHNNPDVLKSAKDMGVSGH